MFYQFVSLTWIVMDSDSALRAGGLDYLLLHPDKAARGIQILPNEEVTGELLRSYL